MREALHQVLQWQKELLKMDETSGELKVEIEKEREKGTEKETETENGHNESTVNGKRFHIPDRQKRRKGLIRTIILIFVFLAVWLFYRFGWKYMGFQMTTDPSYISVYNVGIYEPGNYAFVSGNSPMNIGTYAGAVTEFDEKTGTLYVGIRFNLTGRNTEFRVEYPQDKALVNKIVLKKNDTERVIWERGAE